MAAGHGLGLEFIDFKSMYTNNKFSISMHEVAILCMAIPFVSLHVRVIWHCHTTTAIHTITCFD